MNGRTRGRTDVRTQPTRRFFLKIQLAPMGAFSNRVSYVNDFSDFLRNSGLNRAAKPIPIKFALHQFRGIGHSMASTASVPRLSGSLPRSSPAAAKRGVEDAGLEVGNEPERSYRLPSFAN
jgi:hypothetical protein